jgi:hypothetical protein
MARCSTSNCRLSDPGPRKRVDDGGHGERLEVILRRLPVWLKLRFEHLAGLCSLCDDARQRNARR